MTILYIHFPIMVFDNIFNKNCFTAASCKFNVIPIMEIIVRLIIILFISPITQAVQPKPVIDRHIALFTAKIIIILLND